MEGKAKLFTRRGFLSYLIAAVGAFIGTVLSISIAGFVISPALKKGEAKWLLAGQADQFEIGKPNLVEFTITRRDGWVKETQQKSVWVVARSAEEFAIYNARCTHLGCLVSWLPERQVFRSPCHNGIFAIDGKVVSGPPPRPLDTLDYKVEGGNLLVLYKEFRLGAPDKVEV